MEREEGTLVHSEGVGRHAHLLTAGQNPEARPRLRLHWSNL